jgi:hypothetical protein
MQGAAFRKSRVGGGCYRDDEKHSSSEASDRKPPLMEVFYRTILIDRLLSQITAGGRRRFARFGHRSSRRVRCRIVSLIRAGA